MSTIRKERPGADTPWASINKILKPGERFSYAEGGCAGYLFAPADFGSFSALLYTMKGEQIPFSFEAEARPLSFRSVDSVLVSARAIREVTFPDYGIVKAGAGCDLQTLHGIIYESGYETSCNVSLFTGVKGTVGSALLEGGCSGALLRETGMFENVLGVEIMKDDGTLLRWGGARSFSPGPALHKLACGSKITDGIIVSCSLRVFPIPPKRLFLSWSFLDRKELELHIGLLLQVTTSWERLDSVIPADIHEKGFVLAQISGSVEEMELFMQLCPRFNEASGENRTIRLAGYLLKKMLTIRSLCNPDPFTVPPNVSYLWYHFAVKRGVYFESADP